MADHITPEEDHDPTECLVEYLASEWFDAWRRNAKRRPTNTEDVDFRKAAFAILESGPRRMDHLFAAAVAAGRDESVNLVDHFDACVLADPETVEHNAAVRWFTQWIRVDPQCPPTSEQTLALAHSVKAAMRASYKPEAIIDAAEFVGHHRETDLGRYLASVADLSALNDSDPWPTA